MVSVDSSVFVAEVNVVPAELWVETCVIKFSPDACAAAMAASPTRIMSEAFSLVLDMVLACAIAAKVTGIASSEQCGA